MSKMVRGDITIIYPSAGFGLPQDAKILEKALLSLGYRVTLCEFESSEFQPQFGFGASMLHALRKFNCLYLWKKIQKKIYSKPSDIYIYLENVIYQKLFHNAIHILVPNQEWFRITGIELLPHVERVWCKSFLAKNIFSELGAKTFYTGFVSNRVNTNTSLTFARKEFISRVGISALRGVNVLVGVWAEHPEWPCLNIVVHESRRIFPCPSNVKYVDEFATAEEYQQFSSEFQFQIFATETEGFGHAIYEGVSSGATVLLTDAAPMNEVLDNKSVIFIMAKYNGHKGLSPRFIVTKEGIELSVSRALLLTDAERTTMAANAMQVLTQMESMFISNLNNAMNTIVAAQKKNT
jgi:hypothetical protein